MKLKRAVKIVAFVILSVVPFGLPIFLIYLFISRNLKRRTSDKKQDRNKRENHSGM